MSGICKMRYTRQQILEKLEFWKKELEKLDESRSPLIDALVDEFGDELIRMKEDDDKKIKHDPHGEVFKKFMIHANDLYGLSAELVVDLGHVADEFARSMLAAREKINEDGTNNDDGRIVVSDENLLVIDHGNGLRTVNMY